MRTKRARPSAHTRRIKTKNGYKKVKINPGIKRAKRSKSASSIITELRKTDNQLKRNYERGYQGMSNKEIIEPLQHYDRLLGEAQKRNIDVSGIFKSKRQKARKVKKAKRSKSNPYKGRDMFIQNFTSGIKNAIKEYESAKAEGDDFKRALAYRKIENIGKNAEEYFAAKDKKARRGSVFNGMIKKFNNIDEMNEWFAEKAPELEKQTEGRGSIIAKPLGKKRYKIMVEDLPDQGDQAEVAMERQLDEYLRSQE